jgi:hypothetical protein
MVVALTVKKPRRGASLFFLDTFKDATTSERVFAFSGDEVNKRDSRDWQLIILNAVIVDKQGLIGRKSRLRATTSRPASVILSEKRTIFNLTPENKGLNRQFSAKLEKLLLKTPIPLVGKSLNKGCFEYNNK